MEDFTSPQPQCEHKFKMGQDGMLTCEMCGLKQAPRKQAAVDPGSAGSQPVYVGPEVDTSKAAAAIKKRREGNERLNFSARVAQIGSDIFDFITFWN